MSRFKVLKMLPHEEWQDVLQQARDLTASVSRRIQPSRSRGDHISRHCCIFSTKDSRCKPKYFMLNKPWILFSGTVHCPTVCFSWKACSCTLWEAFWRMTSTLLVYSRLDIFKILQPVPGLWITAQIFECLMLLIGLVSCSLIHLFPLVKEIINQSELCRRD